eukprot:scaffold2.g7360.t1
MSWSPSSFSWDPYALVPGCGVELVDSKTYYRRYRICVEHCNLPSMIVDGKRCRFCQQCGRFHDIVEFEGTRKSCRNKLKRHNERRRSAAPAKKKKAARRTAADTDTEEEDEEDIEMVDSDEDTGGAVKARTRFTSSRRKAAPAPKSAAPASSEEATNSSNAWQVGQSAPPPRHAAHLSPSPTEAAAGWEVLTTAAPLPPLSVPMEALRLEQHPLHVNLPSMPSSSTGLLTSSCLHLGLASASATSSDAPTPAAHAWPPSAPRTSSGAPGRVPLPGEDPILDQMLAELLEDDKLQERPHPQLLNGLASPAPAPAPPAPARGMPPPPPRTAAMVDDMLLEMLDLPMDAPDDDLPLMPLPREVAAAAAPRPPPAPPVAPLAPALRCLAPSPPVATVVHVATPPALACLPPGASALQSAMAMVSAGPCAVPLVAYTSPDTVMRVSLKVFNCTPDQLVPSVRSELESMLSMSQSMLEGYIRPGCTVLTLESRHSRQGEGGELRGLSARHAVESLLFGAGKSPALDQDMLVQIQDEVAVVKQRRVVAVVSTTHSAALVPALEAAQPLCVEEGEALKLLLCGRNIAGPQDLLLARQHGQNLTVEIHRAGVVRSTGAEWAQVRVLGAVAGCVELEVQRGMFLSAARPVLLLPCAAAVAEVRQLEQNAAGVPDVDALLRDIGLVAQYLARDRLAAAGRPQPTYGSVLLACVANLARRLVATAAARGWPALAQLLLPATTVDGASAAAAAAAISTACPAGTSLLHVAVGTGSVAVVQALAAWAKAQGAGWDVDARGMSGVTPLHVAALLPNGGAMLSALTELNPAAPKLWTLVQADDGSTPEAFAEARAAAARGGAAEAAAGTSAAAKAGGAGAEAGEAPRPSSSDMSTDSDLSSCASSELEMEVSLLAEPEPEALKRAAAGGKRGAAGASGKGSGEPAALRSRARVGRLQAKQKLGGLHISGIMQEVEEGAAGGVGDGGLRAAALGGVVAAGTGLAALLLHAWGYGL